MSDVTYIYGTIEYLILEIDWTAPGQTFTATDWTAQVTLCAVGTPFNTATASWTSAALGLVGTTNYVQILVGSTLNPTVGKYKAFVKLTKTAEPTEYPVIECRGLVKVVSG